MKSLIKKYILELTFLFLILGGCKNRTSQQYNLSSGTAYNSNDGFKMRVKITGTEIRDAEIETKYYSTMPSKQKVLNDFGELNINEILKDSVRVSFDIFKNVIVHKINIPSNGKKYWFVYFDPKYEPTPVNRMISGGSSAAIGCCCGEAGDGCYIENGQCLTKVCNACTNSFVKVDNANIATVISYNRGFAIVQADRVILNGKKFEYSNN